MHNLEFRGRWLDIFGNILLISILTTITLGIYAPWGYARYQRVVATRTYYRDAPLQFDGTGLQAFVEFLIIGALSLVTLGLYVILGFAQTRLLRWQYAHTILPTGQRLVYRGDAIDLFFEVFLMVFFSILTLGIYYFWGHVRVQRYILTHTYLEEKPLAFAGRGAQYLGIVLINALLTVITLGIYALLGFATVRLLRWSMGNTSVPEPERASRPMPVHSPTVGALSGAAAERPRSEPMAEYPDPAEDLPQPSEQPFRPGAVRAYPQEEERPYADERDYRYSQEEDRAYTDERGRFYAHDEYTPRDYPEERYPGQRYPSDPYSREQYSEEEERTYPHDRPRQDLPPTQDYDRSYPRSESERGYRSDSPSDYPSRYTRDYRPDEDRYGEERYGEERYPEERRYDADYGARQRPAWQEPEEENEFDIFPRPRRDERYSDPEDREYPDENDRDRGYRR